MFGNCGCICVVTARVCFGGAPGVTIRGLWHSMLTWQVWHIACASGTISSGCKQRQVVSVLATVVTLCSANQRLHCRLVAASLASCGWKKSKSMQDRTAV